MRLIVVIATLMVAACGAPVMADGSDAPATDATAADTSSVTTIVSPPLVAAARARVGVTLAYDPAYRGLDYPGGDVADDVGVCSDVLVRAARAALDIDLQRELHEDMRANFSDYPDTWGLSRPDRNIDHRRVPNLETWLARQGAEIPASDDPRDYRPGDIVTFRLDGRLPHIGIVSDRRARDGTPLLIHNVGAGTREEDALFAYPLHRRFRWSP